MSVTVHAERDSTSRPDTPTPHRPRSPDTTVVVAVIPIGAATDVETRWLPGAILCAIGLAALSLFPLIPAYNRSISTVVTASCGHGVRDNETGLCDCVFGYAQMTNASGCDYAQKFQYAAVAWQAIPWTGLFSVGYWYIGDYAYAAVQGLVLPASMYLFFRCAGAPFHDDRRLCDVNELDRSCGLIMARVTAVAIALWWVASVLQLCLDSTLTDSNGVPLAS
jgi:hypothetical protein